MMKKNPFSIEGKCILITGASSGIGREIAIQCADAGAKVIITGRNTKRLEETYQQLNGSGHKIIVEDIANDKGIENLVSKIEYLEGVIHSAGILKRLPLKFITRSKLEELININFFSSVLLTQKLFKKKLIKHGGSIVFISSVAASFASLGNIMYMASKGAVNSFVKGVAFELASQGIRANAIQPGMIKTNMTTAIPDEEIQKDIARYPLARYGKPEEIAYAAIYLISDATQWMTGSILTIDGGLTLK